MERPLAPSGPGGLGLRSVRAIQRDPLAFFASVPRQYGDLARYRLGPYRFHAVNHPELIGEVLVADARGYRKGVVLERARAVLGNGLLTSEDEVHARQRRLVAHAFAPRRVAGYVPTFARRASATADSWRDGATVELRHEMTSLTLSVVVATLFGSALDEHEGDDIGDALTQALAAFERLVTHPLGARAVGLPFGPGPVLREARARLYGSVDRLVAARRRDGGDDLLADLVAAREDGSGMDEQLLRDEVLTLMLAGHETTANWLVWTWLLLAAHPEAEAAVHAELDALHGPLTAAELGRLPFLDAVLAESLRLYPPVWGIGRRARDERTLGGCRIPAGSVMSISQWVVQRDPRWWPEPERFDPARFAGGAPAAPRFAYFPFAAGPRSCIGSAFARTEALVLLATLARRWRLLPLAAGVPRPQARVTLRPAEPALVRLEARRP